MLPTGPACRAGRASRDRLAAAARPRRPAPGAPRPCPAPRARRAPLVLLLLLALARGWAAARVRAQRRRARRPGRATHDLHVDGRAAATCCTRPAASPRAEGGRRHRACTRRAGPGGRRHGDRADRPARRRARRSSTRPGRPLLGRRRVLRPAAAGRASTTSASWTRCSTTSPTHAPVDRARQALVGYSSGGMLTYRYVCARPGTLAAAVVVSGSLESPCGTRHQRARRAHPARPEGRHDRAGEERVRQGARASRRPRSAGR